MERGTARTDRQFIPWWMEPGVEPEGLRYWRVQRSVGVPGVPGGASLEESKSNTWNFIQ